MIIPQGQSRLLFRFNAWTFLLNDFDDRRGWIIEALVCLLFVGSNGEDDYNDCSSCWFVIPLLEAFHELCSRQRNCLVGIETSSEEMPAPPPPPQSLPEAPTCEKTEVNDGDSLPPWAKITLTSAEAEIEKLIARNELKDAEVTYFCQVEPILQDGPQCGLVALAMASQEYTKPVSVSQLLAEARVRGFTQHGEVYSVDFMGTLAAEYLPDHRPDILVDLQTCPDSLTHALAHGAMVLIPYDSDFNHAPCLKRGHKAHWALLVGLISSRQGYHVLARQGKSRHLACWPLRDLIESNGNLEEEGTARHAGGYVIPKGGVGGQRGLRGRALALHPYI